MLQMYLDCGSLFNAPCSSISANSLAKSCDSVFVVFAERAAKVAEQQERERAAQQLAFPRAGTPVGL